MSFFYLLTRLYQKNCVSECRNYIFVDTIITVHIFSLDNETEPPAYPGHEQQEESYLVQPQSTPSTHTQNAYPGNTAYSYPQQSQYPSAPVTTNTVVS